jgi:hypothetical protein
MKVKVLAEHRYEGEPKEVDKSYELPNELAKRAISEGWVEAVQEKKKK